MPAKIIAIAPMMDYTDKHFRYLMRLITKKTLLFTEMITTGAIIHGDQQKFLSYNHAEHPVAIQIGGRDPNDILKSCKIIEDYGYDEINLNVGCPSSAVKSGGFGASLMLEPEHVASIINHIQGKISVPLSVKCRIGIDSCDSYDFLRKFILSLHTGICRESQDY